MGKNMDAYGVPNRRAHHGQWSGARQGGLKPAGSSGGGTSLAVRVAIPSGLMISLALAAAKGLTGWSPSPLTIVGAATVLVAVIVAGLLVFNQRAVSS